MWLKVTANQRCTSRKKHAHSSVKLPWHILCQMVSCFTAARAFLCCTAPPCPPRSVGVAGMSGEQQGSEYALGIAPRSKDTHQCLQSPLGVDKTAAQFRRQGQTFTPLHHHLCYVRLCSSLAAKFVLLSNQSWAINCLTTAFYALRTHKKSPLSERTT